MNRYPYILAPLGLILLSGCVATQRDVSDLSSQMDDMKLQMSQLQGTMESLQKNQADLFVRMDQVQTSMTSLNENLGDFNHQMSTLKTRWDDLEARVDGRMRSVQENVTKQQAEEVAALPGRTFRDAELNLLKKNYDLAIQGFGLYLKQSPQGELADQAVYHIGEAQADKGDAASAAKSFATVLDRYPRSRLTAASRLRYALALLKLKGKGEEAQRYLQSVIDDFPKSQEAAAAAEHLSALQPAAPAEAKRAAKTRKPRKRAAKTADQ